jgi:hypothetical protein
MRDDRDPPLWQIIGMGLIGAITLYFMLVLAFLI